MPGILGGTGVSEEHRQQLEQELLSRWPDAIVEVSGTSFLGGHSFGDAPAVHRIGPDRLVGLDGEWSLYQEVKAAFGAVSAQGNEGGVNDRTTSSAGNVAVVDAAAGVVRLSVDASGTFPLYYMEHGGGLLFGWLLTPLARISGAERDDLAVLEFLRQAYTVGGRTPFLGIKRLLPGQSLTYRSSKGLRITERSTAWAAGDAELDRDGAAEEAWERLSAAIRRGTGEDAAVALMMSGGWDSRTLLGVLQESDRITTSYSHGDTASRELAIVRRLSGAASVSCHLEPIDDRVLDPQLLRKGFKRTENVVFPHWHRAGSVLSDRGAEIVTAGVFGEILGGHYGPAMLSGHLGKVRAVADSLLGVQWSSPAARSSVREFLHIGSLGRHWYLDPDYERSIESPRERMNTSIDEAVSRLEERGVQSDISLVEAFVSEHRGTQYINAQLLSCRAHLDVAVPFAGGELFSFSTRVPFQAKVHNSLNRRMLARHAPQLLREPMAATLVPAGWPILLQEASRVVRKITERGQALVHRRTRGRAGRPRLGWVNFDFLTDTRALRGIADDLEADIWDHRAIQRLVDNLAHADRRTLHPIYDQLAKVYTIDLLIRNGVQ